MTTEPIYRVSFRTHAPLGAPYRVRLFVSRTGALRFADALTEQGVDHDIQVDPSPDWQHLFDDLDSIDPNPRSIR